MEWYLTVLKKYVIFEGRARRQEFWMFTLVNIIILAALAILMQAVGNIFTVLYVLYALAVFLPSLAVTVRRLHDTGRSGFWVFISLIPLVGSIILIVFLAIAGDQGDNAYGPDPKAAPVAA
ncbi:MAG TPA: DUF805 domain-containing protein [Jiangellaceae bacterium]